jgi:hypothetical protein
VDLVKIFHDIDCLILNEINQLVDDGLENKHNFLSLDPELHLDGLFMSCLALESRQEEIYWVLGSIQYSEGAIKPRAQLPKLSPGTRVRQQTAITLPEAYQSSSLSVLKIQEEARDVFNSIEEELLKRRTNDLRRGITRRIESLDGFEIVYNEQTIGRDEPTFVRHEKRRDATKKVPAAFSQRHQYVSFQLFTNVLGSHLTL